jgi:putative transposase
VDYTPNKHGRHKMPNIKSNNQAKIDYKYLIKYEYMRIQYNHKNDSTFNQIYMLIHKLSNLPKSYILKVIGHPRSVYYYQIKKAKLSDKNNKVERLIKKNY